MGKGPDTNTGTTGLRRVTDLSLEIMRESVSFLDYSREENLL